MIRITGGELRGRPIRTPASQRTRPTQAKMRQALFNSLQNSISEARVLDLYAGSGALGFEALSWGAADVVFVESARPVSRLILENARDLGVSDRVRVISERVDEAWGRLESMGPFDIVLADPPYAEFVAHRGEAATGFLGQSRWKRLLKEGGLICLETVVSKELPEGLPERFEFLVKVREKNYGDSLLSTYRRENREVADDVATEP